MSKRELFMNVIPLLEIVKEGIPFEVNFRYF